MIYLIITVLSFALLWSVSSFRQASIVAAILATVAMLQ